MEENKEIFEGAVIGDKQFPFVRVTVAKQAKIINKFKPTIINSICQWLWPERNNLRMWKRVRSVAFVKTGLWKWLWFLPFEFVVPKELRCSEMSLKQAGELQASFFARVGEIVKGHDAPLLSLNSSQTQKPEVS